MPVSQTSLAKNFSAHHFLEKEKFHSDSLCPTPCVKMSPGMVRLDATSRMKIGFCKPGGGAFPVAGASPAVVPCTAKNKNF